MREIKKIIVNILASTCIVLLLLVAVAIIIDGVSVRDLIKEGSIRVDVFLQIFAGNTVVCLGLFFTRKFESRYAVFEYLLDITYVVIIILVFGAVFGWFSTRPWILAVIAVTVYIFALLTNIVRTKKEAEEINELLQKRKEKNNGTAT
jgi:hypothetical protein